MMAEGSLDRVDRETNQVNQTIAANIGFESKEDAPFGYLLDLGYINFSHKYVEQEYRWTDGAYFRGEV